jgi:hypothetical protein
VQPPQLELRRPERATDLYSSHSIDFEANFPGRIERARRGGYHLLCRFEVSHEWRCKGHISEMQI